MLQKIVCYKHFLLHQQFFQNLKTENMVHKERSCFQQFSILTLSQTNPGFHVSAVQVFWKTPWEKEKLIIMINFVSYSHSVFHQFREFAAIFIKSNLSSANSYSLEAPKICCLGKE